MPFTTSRRIAAGSTLSADICIVGAGPAGLALATELASAGRHVLVIEAGGIGSERSTAEKADSGRQGFGGTSWYGRCVPLDAIDFEKRSWVAGSGWPISSDEIASRHARAAQFLGLPDADLLAEPAWHGEATHQALGGHGLTVAAHLITRGKDLGARFKRTVETASRLTVVLDAVVAAIDLAPSGGAVTGLRVRGADGHLFRAEARHYVLAGGGLENPRLLLMLLTERPGALGAASDAVGRYYMNHVRTDGVAKLRLDPANPHYVNLFRGLTEGHNARARCRTQFACNLDADIQRREHLLNACAFFYVSSTTQVSELGSDVQRLKQSVSSRRFGSSELESAVRVTRYLPLVAQAGLAQLRRRPFAVESLSMVDQIEQAPDPDRRLTLAAERDQWDRPHLRVPWHVDAITKRTQRRLHQLIAEQVLRARAGHLESRLDDADIDAELGDAAHPSGGTRMSTDPKAGVVDVHSRVHGLDNLHVAGSSIFPTAGQANPTLTIVALALRLADTLRK